MSHSILITKNAESDLSHIYAYTVLHFGEKQWNKYESLILESIKRISIFPKLGNEKPHLPKNYRVFPVSKHLIIYRVNDNELIILRILHQRMDFSAQFSKDES